MKKIIGFFMAVVLVVGLIGCGSTPKEKDSSGSNTEASVKVGLILSTGGLGDKNFNDMAYNGMLKAQEELGIEFDYVEPKSVSDFLAQYRMFAESGEYDLIVGLGMDQIEAVGEIIKDFPEQKISLLDAVVELPNVSAVQTYWPEQTFLSGVIAGLGTKSEMEKANSENVVGVILGMDLPNLREGLAGFVTGVKYVNPDAEVIEATVGSFNDPGKSKEIALSMYNRGADFIQHISGASGLGVFNAAKEANRYAFGVGPNQNWEEPDYIVASSVRHLDAMIFQEIKGFCDGEWTEGVKLNGMKAGSVGYDVSQSNVVLPEEIQAVVDEIEAKIISGELVLCKNETDMEEWLKNNRYE